LIHAVGSALSAYLTAVIRVSMGDYSLAFFAGGAFAITASILSLRLPKPSPIDRTAVASVEPTTVV